ncbi:hypothetical protein AgCh_028377 [Apium graveolens]
MARVLDHGHGLEYTNPCYEIDNYKVDMNEAVLIGEGVYGEVYIVKWRGIEVAAKTIRSSIASNQMVRKTFLKELALWQKLRHPNIVQFLGILKDSERLIFLTEYLRNMLLALMDEAYTGSVGNGGADSEFEDSNTMASGDPLFIEILKDENVGLAKPSAPALIKRAAAPEVQKVSVPALIKRAAAPGRGADF